MNHITCRVEKRTWLLSRLSSFISFILWVLPDKQKGHLCELQVNVFHHHILNLVLLDFTVTNPGTLSTNVAVLVYRLFFDTSIMISVTLEREGA